MIGPDYPSAAALRVRTSDIAPPDWIQRDQSPVGAKFTHGDVFRLAPGEWLFIGVDPSLVGRAVEAALGEHLWHLADMTGGWARIELTGVQVPKLLAKGCSIDLHPRSFAVGAYVQTRIADIQALLRRRERSFELLVERPLAAHLTEWLTVVGAEYQMTESAE
jgi:sarcosine oxidase subunit gamma